MVVGLDFCFGFPAWFVRECEVGCGGWAGVLGAGGRRAWASDGLRAECADMRFWGKHHKGRRSSAASGCTGCCARQTSTASWRR